MQTKDRVDLRRYERVPAAWSVSLVLSPENFKTDRSASALDVSVSGMSVRTTLPIAPGEWVGVVLRGDFPHAIPTSVVWVHEEKDPDSVVWIRAGLKFLNYADA